MRQQSIESFMSTVLVVIDPRRSLGEASRLMRLHDIRHLPVVDRGRVVGLLSQRDVYLVETLSDSDPEEIRVEEAMTPEPFVVDPEDPVHSVAHRMAEKKLGSAVVAHEGKLLGLFTVTDALRALAVFTRPGAQVLEIESYPGEEDV